MTEQDNIIKQQRLLETNRRTLSHYLEQRAMLGTAHIPPGITHGIHEARENIRRIKGILRTWNVPVDEHPDDEDVITVPQDVQGATREVIVKTTRSLRVFLCHSSGDKPTVRNLYDRLRADGINPWLDEKNLLPGQDWQQEIQKAVRASDVVLVCLSRASITKTGYVQKEIREALDVADEQPDGAIFLIPLKLEECEVPYRLRRWHWVNFFEEEGHERLMNALQHRTASLGLNEPPTTKPHLDTGHNQKKTVITRRAKLSRELFAAMFSSLSEHYGTQDWWIREDKFQQCLEAILSQGTGWKNVELAIENIKHHADLTPRAIYNMSDEELRRLIRPCGYAKAKASYIKNFVNYLDQHYELNIENMLQEETNALRRRLMEINGIGNFTRDNILLYIADRSVLPINERMRKIFFEHELIDESDTYHSVQTRIESILPFNTWEIREFDATIYRVARDYCHSVPRCDDCPLKSFLPKHGPKSQRQQIIIKER